MQSKRSHLSHLVHKKNKWFRPLTAEEKRLGFLGWHERGYLPHCDYPGLTQFVTFRLADSMPKSKRGEWEHLLRIEDAREKRSKLEQYLDRGIGKCALARTDLAKAAEETLLFFHNKKYELIAWCVMPNHVHVLLEVWNTPLSRLVQSWKRSVAFAARLERRITTRQFGQLAETPSRNSALQMALWEREYWDTFMRDSDQELKAIHYIENNPVKARLCCSPNVWTAAVLGFVINMLGWFCQAVTSPSRNSALRSLARNGEVDGVLALQARQVNRPFVIDRDAVIIDCRVRDVPAIGHACAEKNRIGFVARRQFDVGENMAVAQVRNGFVSNDPKRRRSAFDFDYLAIFKPTFRSAEREPQSIRPAVFIDIPVLHEDVA